MRYAMLDEPSLSAAIVHPCLTQPRAICLLKECAAPTIGLSSVTAVRQSFEPLSLAE